MQPLNAFLLLRIDSSHKHESCLPHRSLLLDNSNKSSGKCHRRRAPHAEDLTDFMRGQSQWEENKNKMLHLNFHTMMLLLVLMLIWMQMMSMKMMTLPAANIF